MLRAGLVLFTSVASGLLLGSGAAAILGGRCLVVEPAHRYATVVAADRVEVDADAITAGGLFAPTSDAPPIPGAGATETPTCDPSLRLVGVAVIHTEPKRAYAAIVARTERVVVGPGASFGSHTVVRVDPELAVLRQADGPLCELRLFGPREPTVTPAPSPAPDPLAGIHRLGPRHVRIDPRALDAANTHRPTIRPIPTPDGVRLFGIRAGSAPYAAGLRNGDTIVGVDGQPATPDVGMAAYARARAGEPVRVQIERGGQPVEMTYELSRPD